MGIIDILRKYCIIKKVRDKADDPEKEESSHNEKLDKSKQDENLDKSKD